ncbi:MAG: hypothetical protein V7603_5926 [Micromonosporaceae bacterium]
MSVDHEIYDEHPEASPDAGLAGEIAAGEMAAEDVAASRGGSRWAVAATDWQNLPPEVVELLAAPVVVTAQELPAPASGSGPEGDEGSDHPAPDEPCAVMRGYGECMPSFIAPAVFTPAGFGTGALAVAGMPRSRRARRRI